MTRILVVDDEPQIVRALRITLQARGYDVAVATSGGQALVSAASQPPDIVVLDLGLPDVDGVQVVRELRAWTNLPILILSGRTHSVAKVRALEAGADDYVTKPFDVDELIARIRAVSRRSAQASPPAPVHVGDYVVDLQARRVTPGPGRPDAPDVHLTPTEWQLLDALIHNPGRLLTQRQLVQIVRGPQHSDDTSYVRQFMAQLRRKLERDPARPRHLLTEAGMGYRFQP